MIWLNLVVVVLVSAYAQWLFYRGWRFVRELSHTDTAEDVLENVVAQRRFYLQQGLGSLIGLVVFLGVKTLLLLFKLSEPSAFTTFALGDFSSGFFIVKLGCLGVGLTVIVLGCSYQWLKSKHYFEVLYALRSPLGLHPEPKVRHAPPLPPSVAPHHVA